MKNLFFIILVVLCFSSVSKAEIKVTNCLDLIETLVEAINKKIPASKISEVQNLGKKFKIPKSKRDRWKTYPEAISDAFETIAEKYSKTSKKAGNEMAKFGEELREFYKNLEKRERIQIDFLVARNVIELERFEPSEFKKVSSFILEYNSEETHLAYPDYEKYVKGYVKNKAPYTNIESNAGLLTRDDIRDIQTYNLWPIYMLPHDIKHVHFGISHPLAMATVLKSARSKNHLRYVMISALFEGVENVQYFEETALCRYMANELGMELEEAMVYLGRATEEELKKIAKKTGYQDDFFELVKDFKNYKPKKSGNFQGLGTTGTSLEEELDDMVKNLRKLENKSGIKAVMKYTVDPENPGGDPDAINF